MLKLYGPGATFEDAKKLRREDALIVQKLIEGKLKGRIRTGFRAAPSSNSDVISGDVEGDVVTDATYKYELLTVSGSLKWHRTTLNISW